jgi:adenosylmethionine-8-amino-7-oxononanoate aminotransferase
MAAIVLGPFPTEARVAHHVALACRDEGVIVRCLGDAVVVMPPLAMEPGDLRRIVAAVGSALLRVAGPPTAAPIAGA